jgi:hypothetical protein
MGEPLIEAWSASAAAANRIAAGGAIPDHVLQPVAPHADRRTAECSHNAHYRQSRHRCRQQKFCRRHFVVIAVPRRLRSPVPDEFLCLTPAILLSYPTEWLRAGSGPSPLNRWEISKANESQMQSMVSDICISGYGRMPRGRVSSMPELQPFTSRRRRSSASVRELLN